MYTIRQILNPDIIEKMVSRELMEAYHDAMTIPIDENNDDFLYCLQRVIEYYTTADEYERWQEDLALEKEYEQYLNNTEADDEGE